MSAKRRRRIAASLVLVLFGLVVVVAQQSSEVTAGSKGDWYDEDGSWIGRAFDNVKEHPTPSEAPVPDAPPTLGLPELDDTLLQANLSALSAADRALVEHHLDAPLGEGTWIIASPMTVEEARLRLLGPDPQPARRRDFLSGDSSAYAFLQVGSGVVAWESWGFADPPRRLLADLSRDGNVVFDAREYAFLDSIDEIPTEVRDLARLAWEDLDGPLVETADWSTVALAMAEKITGVRADPAVRDLSGKKNWYAAPMPWGAG